MAPTAERHVATERALMARLRSIYGGRPWLVAGEVAQGVAPGAEALRSLGASDVLVVATRGGVGDLPPDVPIIMSDGSLVADDASMIERMHDNNRELHDLPAWVIAEVDAWDPPRRAGVIVSFTIDAGLVAGRPTFGARRPEWASLEDKITVRELWRHAGVTTAPDRVVQLADAHEPMAAHRELASAFGTVWAVDNSKGWHGGGSGTHWVPDEASARALMTELAPEYEQARIQPFLEGVPCSIHGLVLPDHTIALRPCEMVVLLDRASHRFVYSRAATFWDPTAEDRADMRRCARLIGDALRETADYRGVFTLDGVLTADGFRPTEVNPRFGAALPPRLRTDDGGELRTFFVHLAAVEGLLDDLDPSELEALLVARLDQQRAGGAFIRTEHAPDGDSRKVSLTARVHDGRLIDLREPADGEPVMMQAEWGADAGAGIVYVRFTDSMPVGPAVAPTVVALRERLGQLWNLDLAEATPAFDV